MRILITRPRTDSEAFAALVTARGHTPVVAPVMEVQFLSGPALNLQGAQAVLATSANGVRAFAAREAKRDIALYAVGPQTAEAARAAGFAQVVSAGGDAAALVECVAQKLNPANGSVLHAAGTETAGRMSQALQARGFSVQSEILYTAVAATALPENAARVLRENTLDAIALFSPRSAKVLAGLIADAGLTETCARLEAYCISAATAGAFAPLSFARVSVAGEPNQECMLALIPPA